MHAAEVKHAAVRSGDGDARHALAADPLVSGPLVHAEADPAAATPTEIEATAGHEAAIAVVAADPARSEAKKKRGPKKKQNKSDQFITDMILQKHDDAGFIKTIEKVQSLFDKPHSSYIFKTLRMTAVDL